MMPQFDFLNRRIYLQHSTTVGAAAFTALIGSQQLGLPAEVVKARTALPGFPNFAPKAKRIIYLFQSGAPSQMDLFDPKPELEKRRGEDLPDSIRRGQRLRQPLRLFLRRGGQKPLRHRPQELLQIHHRDIQVRPPLSERPPRKGFPLMTAPIAPIPLALSQPTSPLPPWS